MADSAHDKIVDVASAVRLLEEISEAWRTGTNQVEVYVRNSKHEGARHVRVTAQENLKSGATPSYMASYEVEESFTDSNGDEHEIWVRADFPWQDGSTAEECLARALMWVAME